MPHEEKGGIEDKLGLLIMGNVVGGFLDVSRDRIKLNHAHSIRMICRRPLQTSPCIQYFKNPANTWFYLFYVFCGMSGKWLIPFFGKGQSDPTRGIPGPMGPLGSLGGP